MRTRLLLALLLPALMLATACSGVSLPGADEVLQTEPGPEQTTWQLTGVRERDGQVLVTFKVESGEPRRVVRLRVEGISMIDDATAQRYVVLRGVDDEHLAAKARSGYLQVPADGETTLWMKFAAPPASTRTVSIALPGVGTFDGVPIER